MGFIASLKIFGRCVSYKTDTNQNLQLLREQFTSGGKWPKNLRNPWKWGCRVSNAREQVSGAFSKGNPPSEVVLYLCLFLPQFLPSFLKRSSVPGGTKQQESRTRNMEATSGPLVLQRLSFHHCLESVGLSLDRISRPQPGGSDLTLGICILV